MDASEALARAHDVRYWPARGALHELACKGPASDEGCSCSEVVLGWL